MPSQRLRLLSSLPRVDPEILLWDGGHGGGGCVVPVLRWSTDIPTCHTRRYSSHTTLPSIPSESTALHVLPGPWHARRRVVGHLHHHRERLRPRRPRRYVRLPSRLVYVLDRPTDTGPGFGASSTVYSAVFNDPNSSTDEWRPCAVKVSSTDLSQLIREAHLLGLCRHPNVLRCVPAGPLTV